MSTIARFRRHAQLYGTEGIYEIAATEDFDARELGQLALALRTIDSKWRLTRDQAMNLAVDLIRAGCSDAEIRQLAAVSQPTVREAHSRAADAESFDGAGPVAHTGANLLGAAA